MPMYTYYNSYTIPYYINTTLFHDSLYEEVAITIESKSSKVIKLI